MTQHSNFSKYERRNLLINGNFDSWPEGLTGFTGSHTAAMTHHGYSLDSGALSVEGTAATKPNNNCQYVHLVSTTTGEATLTAAEHSHVLQRVEGYDFVPFIGRKATLSFWVRASVPGIYSIAFRNDNTCDRSYVTEYTINQSNTWERKVVRVIFDYSGGNWNYTTGIGLQVSWTQACGTTYATATIDEWVTGNYIASTNQVNNVATTGNTFYISQCQLELGRKATPIEHIDVSIRGRLLRRYYQTFYNSHKHSTNVGTGTATQYVSSKYPSKMRASPTITYNNAQVWNVTGGWRTATSTANGSIYNDRAMNIFYDTNNSDYSGLQPGLAAGTWYCDARL